METEKPVAGLGARNWFIVAGALLVAVIAGVLSAQFPWFMIAGVFAFIALAWMIYKKPFYGIVLIAFALPFERIGAYELGEMTIRFAQILLIVTAAAWFFRSLVHGRFSLVKNPILIPLGLFLAVNVISIPNTLNLGRTLTVLIYIIFTASLAFIIPNLVRTREQLKKVIIVLMVSFVVVSGFGIFQFLGDMSGLPTEVTGLRDLYTKDILGFTRVQSTAYEPLYFANYLLIPISILFTLFLSGKGIVRSGWLIALFSLGMVNLILTVSRGGYLAIAAALLVVGLFYLKKLFTIKNIMFFLIGAIFVGWVVTSTLGVGGGLFTLEKFEEHITNAFYGASYDERVDTFSQAVDAWRDHPVIGIGVGGFGPYTAPHPSYIPKDGWRIVNNEFVEILAENGLVGLLFFLSLIFVLCLRTIKAIVTTRDGQLRAVTVGLFAALIGVIVQYQTFSTLYIMHVWFLIGLLIACQTIIFQSHDSKYTPLDQKA